MTKFEVGKTYSTRSACDHDCIYRFTVVGRTEKMVTLDAGHGRIVRRKVRPNWQGTAEACDPHGRYSMSPVIDASDTRDLQPTRTM